MYNKKSPTARPLVVAIAAACGLALVMNAPQAAAANAIIAQSFDGGVSALAAPGDSLVKTGGSASPNSYTDNSFLKMSAWAHTGAWWNFQLTFTSDVKVRVQAQAAADFAPGMTVWASGDTVFNGGTSNPTELSDVGINAPHSFNATGDIGDRGTLWMSGAKGNIVETLGNAIAGPRSYGTTETGWDEVMTVGAHDLSSTDNFESGVAGSVGEGFAELLFSGLKPGFYTIFVGGTDGTLGGSPFDVSVSAVPVPAAVYLFGTGVIGLAARRRRARA